MILLKKKDILHQKEKLLMTLRIKLIGGLLLCFFVALVTIFYGGLSGQSISDKSKILREVTFPSLEEARALQQIVSDTKLLFQDALETSDLELLDSAQFYQNNFQDITQRIYRGSKDQDVITLGALYQNYVQNAKRQVYAVVNEEPIKEFFDLGTQQLDDMISTYRQNKRVAFMTSLQSMQSEATSFKQTFVVLGSFVIVVIGMILLVVTNIQKRLGRVVGHASRLAKGDFESKIKTRYDDEIGSLETTFEGMRQALSTYITAQDELVAERTLELELSKNQIQEILDNIDQGIMVMNFEGQIEGEHSARAEDILNTEDIEGRYLVDLLEANSEDRRVFDLWLKTILKPQFQSNWKDRGLDRLNPFSSITTNFKGEKRYLQLDFELILNNKGELGFIMVVVTDITRVKQIEASHQEQEEQVSRLLSFIDNDLDSMSFFIDSASELTTQIKSLSLSEIKMNQENWMREYHTLRGNAGTFGLNALALRASEVEDYLLDLGSDNELQFKSCIQGFLDEITSISDIKQKIIHKDETRIEVDAMLFQKVKIQAQTVQDANLWDSIEKLPSRRWGSYKKRYNRILEEASDRVSKGDINLFLTPESFLIPEDLYEIIDAPIIHLLRNAVDHGIESPQERELLGKGVGSIVLKLEEFPQFYRFELSDNGKGIDPDSLADLALKKGIITTQELKSLSDEDKLNLIFLHGFTSRSSVGYFSGRGVGMDVVKSAIDACNGSIEVLNKQGEGVTFKIKIPKSL